MFRITIIFFFTLCTFFVVLGQPVPGKDENIPFLVTFGKASETKWGDDDKSQAWFAVIPDEITKPVFIRVFDPDIGGENDEKNGEYDTKVRFSVYGGNGCISEKDAKSFNPTGNYKSGIQLFSKVFGESEEYDGKWYTFGPINPVEGENNPEYGGYVFKIIADGLSGDDGNLYRYFLSSSPDENIPVEGGNMFTYEYTFRMHSKAGAEHISHIYPYVDDKVVTVHIHIFDFDHDGIMRIISVAKPGESIKVSGEDEWVESIHKISDSERKTSLDIQFIKLKNVENNNVVMYITNEYGELIRFNTIPIGGIPKYDYKIKVKSIR